MLHRKAFVWLPLVLIHMAEAQHWMLHTPVFLFCLWDPAAPVRALVVKLVQCKRQLHVR